MAINFPNTPSNGDTHAVGEMIFTYDAAKNSWTPLSSASGASVIVSDTPPSSPSSGDLWTDSSNMKMFIYYEDADSSQWVEVSGSSGGGSGGSVGGLFSLHKMEITEDTHELIADYSGTMPAIVSEYININYTTGQLEMEVNDGTEFSIDRDTGILSIEI